MADSSENNGDQTGPESPKVHSILDGVANILGRLGELAEKGEQLRNLQAANGQQDQDAKGVFDFAVRFGNAGMPSSGTGARGPASHAAKPVTPHKERQATPAQQTPVEKRRTTNVDMFEEDDHILLIAEMPGATEESIRVNLEGQRLILSGKNSKATFEGETQIPASNYELPQWTLNNGILEIKLNRAAN